MANKESFVPNQCDEDLDNILDWEENNFFL